LVRTVLLLQQRLNPLHQNTDTSVVVFLSVEELDGRWMGRGNRSSGMRNLERIFQAHFRKEAGASLEGVALGYVFVCPVK